MPEKGKESSEFRVVDKRRFDESGKTRDDAVNNEAARSTETFRSPGKSSIDKPVSPPPSRGAAEAAPRRGERADEDFQRNEQGPGSVDFSSLIMSLATQALVMMGEIPSEQMQGTRNLEGAQQTIDIISMLVEKTRGNLSGEENRLVTEVLAQLRLAFVNSIGK